MSKKFIQFNHNTLSRKLRINLTLDAEIWRKRWMLWVVLLERQPVNLPTCEKKVLGIFFGPKHGPWTNKKSAGAKMAPRKHGRVSPIISRVLKRCQPASNLRQRGKEPRIWGLSQASPASSWGVDEARDWRTLPSTFLGEEGTLDWRHSLAPIPSLSKEHRIRELSLAPASKLGRRSNPGLEIYP